MSKDPRKLSLHPARVAFLAAFVSVSMGGASVHAATNILRGPDQVLPGDATSPALSPLTPEGLAGPPRSIFFRQEALGDLGGARTAFAQQGFAISPVYIGEIMGNPTGGIEQGFTYDGVLNVPLDVDLDRVSRGLFSDLSLHVNALWLHG